MHQLGALQPSRVLRQTSAKCCSTVSLLKSHSTRVPSNPAETKAGSKGCQLTSLMTLFPALGPWQERRSTSLEDTASVSTKIVSAKQCSLIIVLMLWLQYSFVLEPQILSTMSVWWLDCVSIQKYLLSVLVRLWYRRPKELTQLQAHYSSSSP